MNIGIDLDNTITDTTPLINKYLDEYSIETFIPKKDIMESDDLKLSFFNLYLEDIYNNVDPIPHSIEVINKLKDLGYKIFIVTARSYFIETIDAYNITLKWLETHNLKVDKLIIDSFGPKKAQACLNNNISLMIDDDERNIKYLKENNIDYILFDYDNKNTYWNNIYEILKEKKYEEN